MADIANTELSEVSDEELLSQSDPEDTIKLVEQEDSDIDSDEGSIEDMDDEEQEIENTPDDETPNFNVKAIQNKQPNDKVINSNNLIEDDSSDEDDTDDEYLKKLNNTMNESYMNVYHPEQNAHNYDEILSMANVVRNSNGIIIDPLHKSLPFLTKYEKTRIIGYRAQQLNNGARAYVENISEIVDGYQIALKELEEKKIPFILRRPIPGGGSEYWRLSDLEIIV